MHLKRCVLIIIDEKSDDKNSYIIINISKLVHDITHDVTGNMNNYILNCVYIYQFNCRINK